MTALAEKLEPMEGSVREPFMDRMPNTDEVESATQAYELLAPLIDRRSPAELTVKTKTGEHDFDLAPAVAATLLEVLRLFKNGKAVTLVPVGATLTTQQAADMLNVSRPYLIKLIDAGKLPATKVGRHRRLDATTVFAFKRERDRERSDALDDLIGGSADLI